MKMQKQIYMLLSVMLFLVIIALPAYAHELPDLTKTGSVSINMVCDEKAVAGGTLALYRVGEISENDGNYTFALTNEFAESGADLSNADSPETGAALAKYALDKKLAATLLEIGNDGKAAAENLELGLYLVAQIKTADGYEAIAPFLVGVPVNNNGTYIYDVDASPKMSVITEKTTVHPTSEAPAEPNLPKTGQPNLPVPLLAISGMCLLLLGFAIRFASKGARYDKA